MDSHMTLIYQKKTFFYCQGKPARIRLSDSQDLNITALAGFFRSRKQHPVSCPWAVISISALSFAKRRLHACRSNFHIVNFVFTPTRYIQQLQITEYMINPLRVKPEGGGSLYRCPTVNLFRLRFPYLFPRYCLMNWQGTCCEALQRATTDQGDIYCL